MRTSEHDREMKREWYRKNREKILAHYANKSEQRRKTAKEWDMAHPEEARARNRKYRSTSRGKNQTEHDSLVRRFREHGLTLDEYHAIMERQDFLCAICREEPKTTYGGSHDGFHIDHHHVTGRVRGLLCDTCNVGIGMLKDSAAVCEQAAAYLRK